MQFCTTRSFNDFRLQNPMSLLAPRYVIYLLRLASCWHPPLSPPRLPVERSSFRGVRAGLATHQNLASL